MPELRFVLLEDDLSDAELIQNELSRSGLRIAWQHAVGANRIFGKRYRQRRPT
jgi:hypothetical protein